MEKTIEQAIDHGLEAVSSQLYYFSVGFGIVLLILGVILLFSYKKAKAKKGLADYRLISVIFMIGIIAIVSGLVRC